MKKQKVSGKRLIPVGTSSAMMNTPASLALHTLHQPCVLRPHGCELSGPSPCEGLSCNEGENQQLLPWVTGREVETT